MPVGLFLRSASSQTAIPAPPMSQVAVHPVQIPMRAFPNDAGDPPLLQAQAPRLLSLPDDILDELFHSSNHGGDEGGQ